MLFRLIKNRESAQQSRKRKKDRVGDLEIQCAELEGIHSVQKEKLDELQAENVILKAEVTQLVNVVKDSPALSSLLYQVSSLVCNRYCECMLYLRVITDGHVHTCTCYQYSKYSKYPRSINYSTTNTTIAISKSNMLVTYVIFSPCNIICWVLLAVVSSEL